MSWIRSHPEICGRAARALLRRVSETADLAFQTGSNQGSGNRRRERNFGDPQIRLTALARGCGVRLWMNFWLGGLPATEIAPAAAAVPGSAGHRPYPTHSPARLRLGERL